MRDDVTLAMVSCRGVSVRKIILTVNDDAIKQHVCRFRREHEFDRERGGRQPGDGDDGCAPEGARRAVGVAAHVPRTDGGAAFGWGRLYAGAIGTEEGRGVFFEPYAPGGCS